jgi:acyl carrier protein
MTSDVTENDLPGLKVDDAEVVAFVEQYLAERGLVSDPITSQTSLDDAGLDSLATAELLLSARSRLVMAGRLDPEATLLDLPILTTVSDLGTVLRSLGSQ